MIASVGYVFQDSVHILAVRIGEVGGARRDVSDLCVMYCATEVSR
jgi:hypothetical protein